MAKRINHKKLIVYMIEEKITGFKSDEECMKWFNVYDFQNFKTVEEMKTFQGEYGFNIGKARFHINYDDALDVWEDKTEVELDRIARILFSMSLDMDYADCLETAEYEIECITKELETARQNGCNYLLQALEVIAGNNADEENWFDQL